MISSDGWRRYSIWEHSAHVRELYRARARDEAEELTAHAQACELLAPLVAPGDTLLDVGCGSGYLFHALRRRGIPVEYHGVDASATLVEIGREELPRSGLPAERLQAIRIEDLDGEADHVVCVNVLSNLDNWHRPFERLLRIARKSVVLRESLADEAAYSYVHDRYLDEGVELRVHVNTYPRAELASFAAAEGFDLRYVVDRRTGGKPEMVIDHAHHWTFAVATPR